jgi:membrane-associated phospholipid phosphatase
MLQGMTLTLLTVGLTKWATGRTWPTAGRDPFGPDRLDHPEDARTFAPFQAGLAAFPSGHTAVMFALAAALRTSSPELGTLRYLGYPLAVGVGFAMWYGNHHWASDVLSGALIGEALGGAAGRAWRPDEPSIAINYWVLPLPEGAAVGASGRF